MATTLEKQKGRNSGKSATQTARAKNSALRLEYDGQPVEFSTDGWINATPIAQRHGKRLRRWLTAPDTVEYMAALAEALKAPESGAFVRKSSGRGGRIELHPKLAVLFARYCNARFAVWCDLQIDHILRGGLSLMERDLGARSTTPDREHLLTVAAAIVARHRLPFGPVYEALDHFAGVAHAREMTCEQVTDAAQFGARLLAGNATPADFARIEHHRAQLGAAAAQLPLLGGAR
jgi:hypothetical protein